MKVMTVAVYEAQIWLSFVIVKLIQFQPRSPQMSIFYSDMNKSYISFCENAQTNLLYQLEFCEIDFSTRLAGRIMN